MKIELIRDLAITGGIYDCICDPYDKLKNGDPYSSVMVDLERFAEKIVAECCEILSKETIRHDGYGYNQHALHRKIKEHFFGVEE